MVISKPGLIEATVFLKRNMSLIPNNPIDIAEFPVWNTLIPSRHELLDDIDDSHDTENEEDDEEEEKDGDDNDNDDEDDDLSPVPVESEKPTIQVDFKPFNFLVQQHENTKPTESNPIKYILFGFV